MVATEKTALGVLAAVVAWFLFGGSSSGETSAPPGPLAAREVPAVRTAPADHSEWMRTRLQAARNALAALFPFLSDGTREEIARTVLAHWWIETGRWAEWNNGPGNITAGNDWPGKWHRLTHAALRYRAYNTLAEGAEDYLRLISRGRYAGSWAYLLAHPTDGANWYRRLMVEGYSSPSESNATELAGLRQRVVIFAEGSA